jgi:hypothetical protein
VAAAPIGLPQLVQKRIPGPFCIPQLGQNTEAAFAICGVVARIFCPQWTQKALSTGTCAWQEGQGCVAGGGAVGVVADEVLNAEPQCIQNAAPGFTSPLQRGQVVAEANDVFPAGALLSCTGVPHCGQNFFPVTSLPQDVQVVIF